MCLMQPLIRKVNYYETDAMGIVHHSNYIRWFEEARVDFMDKIGYSYKRLTQSGIDIAVIEVCCRYLRPVIFGDTVEIYPNLVQFSPVKMRISYEIKNSDDKNVYTTGESLHCFMNKKHKVIRLDRAVPELYDIFKSVEMQNII